MLSPVPVTSVPPGPYKELRPVPAPSLPTGAMQTGPPWVWVPVSGAVGQVVAKAWVANRPAAASPAKPRYLMVFMRAPVFDCSAPVRCRHEARPVPKLQVTDYKYIYWLPGTGRSLGCKLCRHLVKTRRSQ